MKFTASLAFSLGLISSAFCSSGNYQQCGGSGFQGSTSCADGWQCLCQNQYYSQCLPPNEVAPVGWNQAGCPSTSGCKTKPKSGQTEPSLTSSTATTPTAPSPPSTSSSTSTPGSCDAYTGDKTGYATTTHYYDGTIGACGCGSSGAFSWQLGSGTVWTAAGSAPLFDDGGSSTWCGSGCGGCYELTNVGAIAASGQGDCTGAGESITVMITNLCPADGNEQWCSSPNEYGFGAHFDIMAQGSPADGWNNPVVQYRQVDCPSTLASDYQQCQCAGSSRVRRGLFQDSWLDGH